MEEYLRQMGLFVPPKNDLTNLMSQTFSSQMVKALNEYIDNLDYQTEYLVIHLGIIEKLMKNTLEYAISDWLNVRRQNWLKKYGTLLKIIIISGRGKPSNMPENELFLPFSVVQQYLVPVNKSLNKVKLLELLQKARKYVKE